ncbi:MAG: GAF and ANTAR domain-containing protein [Blastococcus sp.]
MPLDELGGPAFHEQSLESLLQRVVDLTNVAMPGQGEVSITVLAADRPTTAVFTGRLALDCDESQYGHGYGPCLHAATSGELTEIPDYATECRWPEYVQRACERGALSSLSVPLPVGQRTKAALNIYNRAAHAFGDEHRAAAQRFGPYAGLAVSSMFAYHDARQQASNLQAALESRASIDQAKGILMERYKLTADQAFQLLARTSMHVNTKLRHLADELVHTGVFPSQEQQ